MLIQTLRKLTPEAFGLIVAGLIALGACSSQDNATGDYLYPGPGASGGSAGSPGSGGSSWPTVDAQADLPPEKELESSYEFPAATGRYVWVANPLSGRVAYVNGSTLEVRTTQAGNGPTWLSAIPDPNVDTAFVINVSSSSATLLRADDIGNINTVDLQIAEGNDSWSIDPGARWAISWI